MNKPKLFIADERMLELMAFIIRNKIKGIDTKTAFAGKIDFEHQNLPKVANGIRGFTPAHHHAAATVFGVSLDWLFGFSTQMFRDAAAGKAVDVLSQLKAIVQTLETEQPAKPRPAKVSGQKGTLRAVKQKVKQNAGGE